MLKQLFFLALLLPYCWSCQSDSAETTVETESNIKPSPSVNKDFSSIHLIFYNDEKELEFWSKYDESFAFFEQQVIDLKAELPIGLFKCNFNSKNQAFELLFPNEFYERKIQANPNLQFQEAYLIPVNKGMKQEIDQAIFSILIAPNRLKNDNTFEPCFACPHWTAELYGHLKTQLLPFQKRVQ